MKKDRKHFLKLILYALHIIILAFFIWLPLQVNAQSNQKTVSFFVFEDTTASLSFDEISKSSFNAEFKRLQSNRIAFDVTTSAVWLRFRVNSQPEKAQYLELSNPTIHQIDYFLPYPYTTHKHYASGFLKNYSTRPIQIDRFIFPVSTDGSWHYIRLQSGHLLNTDLKIKTINEVISGASTRESLYLLYGGLMLAIIAGVLFYIYLIRYFSYLLYIGYIFFISSINLVEKGFYFQAFWPNNPAINFLFPILPFGVSICLLLFLRKIWLPDPLVNKLFHLNFWIITILPLGAVIFFLKNNQYQYAITITQLHSFIMCFIVVVTSLVCHTRSARDLKKFHKLIIAGLCIFSFGVMVYLLAQNHILPANRFTDNAILIGSSLEVCFFTTALYLHSDMIYRRHKTTLQKNIKLFNS